MHSSSGIGNPVYYVTRPETQYTDTELAIDCPRVKWLWRIEEALPVVYMFNTIGKDTPKYHQWTIRYPEQAPPDARYELVVDDCPTLTTEQEAEVNTRREDLKRIWEKEKAIQDTLLALWSPEGLPVHTRNAVSIQGCDRYIKYCSTVYIKDAPWNIDIEVRVQYAPISIRTGSVANSTSMVHLGCTSLSDAYSVLVDMRLTEYGKFLELTTMSLPIVDGKALNVILIDYLKNSTLGKVAKALSKVGEAMSKAQSK